MKMLTEQLRKDRHITCAPCATNLRPELVPAVQHAIGCPERAAQLRHLHPGAELACGCPNPGSPYPTL